MKRDLTRIERIQTALKDAGADALVCALPMNVLLLSGYSPVTGQSIGVATKNGEIFLIVPEDEQHFAEESWADEVITFSGGSLDELANTLEKIRSPLTKLATKLHLFTRGVVAYESRADYQPSGYVAMHFFYPEMRDLLQQSFHGAKIFAAGKMLEHLRARLTQNEIERVRVACRVAEKAFVDGAKNLRAGLRETEVANVFRAPLSHLIHRAETSRADGFTFCMSGPNAARASAAYQMSTARELVAGDFVLLHCNSYADGFWTDITRTFCLGEPDEKKRKIYNAIFAARDAALKAIRPGATGCDVDKAARDVMAAHGFAKEFKHPTGHGVGFAAINHHALPRLHPLSKDVLETGMVFNVEPGWYEENHGGARHCDMVVVTETGAEILTPFQNSLETLVIG
jgi:Xaa-Pro aminopeptidase